MSDGLRPDQRGTPLKNNLGGLEWKKRSVISVRIRTDQKTLWYETGTVPLFERKLVF